MGFKEQMAENKNPAITNIANYLLSRSDMKARLDDEKKSLNEMFDYIVSEANKQKCGNCACIDDDTVYGWAIHYYDEENLQFNKINASVKSNVTNISKKEMKKNKKKTVEGQMSLF